MHAGMLAFGIGHILFTAAFVGYGLVPAAALAAGAASLALGCWVWRWLRPHLGLEDRRAVLPYLAVIAAMLSCALGAAAGGAPMAAAAAPCCSPSRTSPWHEIASCAQLHEHPVGTAGYYAAQLLLAAGAAPPSAAAPALRPRHPVALAGLPTGR